MRGEGKLSENTDAFSVCVCVGGGVLASFLPACPVHVSPISKKQDAHGSAAANYPALGTAPEEHLQRTMAGAAALSGSADRLVFLMNIQLLNGPSRGLPASAAPLFIALIFRVTVWCLAKKMLSAKREAKKG